MKDVRQGCMDVAVTGSSGPYSTSIGPGNFNSVVMSP